jgi:hypothetical protein
MIAGGSIFLQNIGVYVQDYVLHNDLSPDGSFHVKSIHLTTRPPIFMKIADILGVMDVSIHTGF